MSETLTLKAEFGTSPVGSEVVETESFWNDHGHKETYEYDLIPAETVTVTSAWDNWSVAGVLIVLEHMANPANINVIRFTISQGQSFTATSWVRFAEAHKYLTEFLTNIS